MRTPRRRTVATTAWVTGVALAATAAVTATGGTTDLSTGGPVRVRGTTASAAYPYADAVVREVRYVDTGRLSYTFTLANHGPLPVTVSDLVPHPGAKGTLLRPQALRGQGSTGDDTGFTVWPGDRTRVELVVLMQGCERVSSRAGSLLEQVRVHANVAGVLPRELSLPLPERVHTGSPRDAGCPGSSSATRSPG